MTFWVGMRALGVIIAPARRALIRLIAIPGFALSLVVILLGIFAGPPRDTNRLRYFAATIEIREVVRALDRYRADCGTYPSAAVGLNALVRDSGARGWKGPYLERVPLDPWGRPYHYLWADASAMPEVRSDGADGVPGGELFNADLSSGDLPESIPARGGLVMLGIWLGAWVVLVVCLVALLKQPPRRAEEK